MDYARALEVESCGKLLWKFSAPAVIGMLANALYDVVDRLFIGRAVGVLGLTAITIVRPLFIIILAFSLLIGVGASVTVSLKLGQKQKPEAEHTLGNALLLAIIIPFFITILGLFFREQLLLLFGASREVLPLARQFLTILLLGTIFQVAGHVLAGITRAEGNPKMAMFIMLLGTAINLILNPIFLFVLRLGMMGSALATLCSQYIIFCVMLIYFLSNRSVLRLRFTSFIPNKVILKQILAIGVSSFLSQLTSSATLFLLNKNLVYYGGDTAVAALGIIHTLSMLVMLPVVGINQGMQPIIGYNYGAKNYGRVKKTMGIALLSGTYMTTIGFILLLVFQRQLFAVFSGQNEDLFKVGCKGLGIFLLMLPTVSLQRIEYFEAIGNAKISIFLSLSKQLMFQIPLLFILPHFYRLTGVWLTGAVSDLLTSLLSGIFLVWGLCKLKREPKPSKFVFNKA